MNSKGHEKSLHEASFSYFHDPHKNEIHLFYLYMYFIVENMDFNIETVYHVHRSS